MDEHYAILVSSFADLPEDHEYNHVLEDLTRNTIRAVNIELLPKRISDDTVHIVTPIQPHLYTSTLAEEIRTKLRLKNIRQNIGVNDSWVGMGGTIFRDFQDFFESQLKNAPRMTDLIIVGWMEYVKWVLSQNQWYRIDKPDKVDYWTVHTVPYLQ